LEVDEGENDDFGDLRLQPGSPAIDAGSNEYVPDDVTTDFDRNPRFVDDPATEPDTGAGDPPIVDMGAYEFQVDCDGSGLSISELHQRLVQCVTGPTASLLGPCCAIFDIELDDDIDLSDIARIQRAFSGP
jgi:hypothetical protein